MDIGLQLSTNLKLEQKLSPQMIQSLKLLQVNSLDLEVMIKQELEINPMLEMQEEIETSQEDEIITIKDEFSEVKEKEEALEDLTSVSEKEEVDWEKVFEDGFDLGYKTFGEYDDGGEQTLERSPTYQGNLQDTLIEQLHDKHCGPDVVEVVEYLIFCLDDDGFLRTLKEEPALPEELKGNSSDVLTDQVLNQIEDVLHFELEYVEALPLVRDSFHTLWSLEPLGIGARNLQECLLFQARISSFESNLVLPILEEGFELFKKMKISTLAKKFDATSIEVQAAFKEIAQLEPRPGRGKYGGISPTVTPDVIVDKINGTFIVILNDKNTPILRISQSYGHIIQRGSTASKDEKKFVRDKLNSANWWVRSIEQRKSTIRKVMTTILELQYDFFEDGPEFLKPMILQDVADRIGMHVSTVNRVTNGKFVQTPNGVFELKYFFSSSVEQADGSEISATQTKEAIKRLIENENDQKPLSDQAITTALAGEGMKVARRTIAKYREQMQILPARMRKKF